MLIGKFILLNVINPISTRYKMIKETRWNTVIKLVFIATLIVLVLGMIVVASGITPIEEQTAANNALLGAILATISVYILYWQTRIQEKQIEIEETMLEYETKPILEVVDVDFNKNDIMLIIANYGHGVALNLKLNCLVEAPNVDWFKGTVSQIPVKKLNESKVLEDSSVRPQEEPREFIAQSVTVGRLENQEGSEDHSSFETTMNELIRSGAGEIRISFWITGNPKVGKDTVQSKVCGKFTIDLSPKLEPPDVETCYAFQK